MGEPTGSDRPDPRGRLIVLSGPSGVGKSTIVHRLAERLPLFFSVSVTTRHARPGEEDEVDYRFVSSDRFAAIRDDGELLEWAEYNGHLYGTPAGPVMEALAEGHDVLLDVEVQGALQVSRKFPEALSIFVTPPSHADLERRLRARRDTSDKDIARRLEIARAQLDAAQGNFDHFVLNDEVERAVDQILRILSVPDPSER